MIVVSPATPTHSMNFKYNLGQDENDNSMDAQDSFFALAKPLDGALEPHLDVKSYVCIQWTRTRTPPKPDFCSLTP